MFPTVAVAKPKEVAVFHEYHTVSRFYIAVVALLNDSGQIFACLQVVTDQIGMVLLAIEALR